MENFNNKIPVWANTPAREPQEKSHEYALTSESRKTSQVNASVDRGPLPLVIDIEDATEENVNFRTALWTGNKMQLTLMSINVGDDTGLEKHIDVEQFIRIEEGEGLLLMGDSENNLTFRRRLSDDDAIIIPSEKWHNIINTGRRPLKLYSIYAPPEHPLGTVHVTKSDE